MARGRRPIGALVAVATAGSTLALVAAPVDIAFAATITVETAMNADDGLCSLQEALENANDGPASNEECDPGGEGADTIVFEIAGTGPFELELANSAGLVIDDTVTIDATTQDGWSAGNPQVVLDGQSYSGPVVDLSTATGVTLKGFRIVDTLDPEPGVQAGPGSTISQNVFGPDVNGAPTDLGTGVLVAGVSNVTVQANRIAGTRTAIQLTGTTTDVSIVGNVLGLAADGTTSVPNRHGILVGATPTEPNFEVVQVPATTHGLSIQDNVIASSVTGSPHYAGYGMGLYASSMIDTQIQGNLIGTDVTGQSARPNGVGISIGWGSSGLGQIDAEIGGTNPGDRNVISGNLGEGIALWTEPSVYIRGNYLGVAADGTTPMPNNSGPVPDLDNGPLADEMPGFGNIVIRNYASDNTIGGLLPGEGNVIANSPKAGIVAFTGSRNRFEGNSISGNAGLGIDLGTVGPELNDFGDGDGNVSDGDDPAYANNLQNWPYVVGTDFLPNGDLQVTTYVDSEPQNTNGPVDVQIYESGPDGQGRRFLGHESSDALPGNVTVTIPQAVLGSLTWGDRIVTLAVDDLGNTSEFSDAITLLPPNTIFVNDAGDDPDSFLGDGYCDAGVEAGICTLRAAIEQANADEIPTTILFDLDAMGTSTIQPATELPTITADITIDGILGIDGDHGTCGTWPPQPGVQIVFPSGTIAGLATDYTVGRLTLRGLALGGSPQELLFLGSSGNVVECNFLGTDLTGATQVGSPAFDVFVNGWANPTDTTIRGNLIVGGFAEHIRLAGADGNTVVGNRIGTDLAGTTAFGNVGNAILVTGNDNQIGGVAPGEGNIIRAASDAAIQIGNGPALILDGNSVRGNSIVGNNGIGIDLDGGGVTFNHAGTVAGPNAYQNFPVFSFVTSTNTSTRAIGVLDSEPSRTYAIDVFANTTCDSSWFGEGEQFLGTFDVTTDATGRATIDHTFSTGLGEPFGVTSTATDTVTGNTSEFSFCFAASSPNISWTQAQDIASGASVSQFFTSLLQEKWFKVPVGPGADVNVTVSGLPGSAVSIHTNPNEAYNQATNPSSGVALAAEAADTAFLPSGSLPSGSLPSGSLPSGSLPSGSLPSGSLETGFLPSGSLPSGSLPSGSLPSGSLPSGSLPSGSLPSGSLPSGSLPSGSLPSGSLPSGSLPSGSLPSGSLPSGSLPSGSLPSGSLDAYATASRRSLIAYSANPYSTVQSISRNTFDYGGDLYIRVVGPYTTTQAFTLDVEVTGGVCGSLQPVAGSAFTAPADGTRHTVILTDSSRLDGTPAEIAEALADLTRFALRADVQGVVVDLAGSAFGRVQAANAQADALPNCPFAKNRVADEIKSVVDAYRQANPDLEYVVLAGGADVIPFHQVSDVAGLASEREYVPPVAANSPTEAGLRTGLVKGQDFYGSSTDLTIAGRTLSLPDLAVGRLVDNAADVSIAIEAYEATGGVVTPNSSLVTGYDFVGDAATTVAAELAAGLASTPTTLIQPPGEAPDGPNAWTASQLRGPLLSGDHDVVMLTGHFSAGQLLAADYRTTIQASEVATAAADFADTVVLALGCHGGFSLPGSDLLPGSSPDPDWAKAFLRRGAASFVAATGYAYGDTELEEYGERLFVELTRQMRTGTGAISMGQALVAAKQAYLAQVPQLSGLDEKTLVEMTLYGLPMMKVDVPGARLSPPSTSSIAGTPTAVGGNGFGLTSSSITINPTVTGPTNVPLEDLTNGGIVTTQYSTGRDGVVAIPNEPVLPKQVDVVSVADRVLRGVALRGGTYTDTSNVIPFTSAPTTETSRPIQSFQSDVFYPNQVWMPNFYAAADGGPTRLVTVPQQYKSNAIGDVRGTLRTWTSVNLAMYYLQDDWHLLTQSPITAAAVSAAPAITGVSASVSGGIVTFSVDAQAEGSAGVQSVWILYTGEVGSPYHGTWAPVDLVRDTVDPNRWTGTLDIGGNDAGQLRFMAQAVGGAGLTALATNLGAYYRIGVDNTPPVGVPATSTALSGPSSGVFGQTSTFQVQVGGFTPLAGAVVEFEVAGQRVLTTTNAVGVATLPFTPNVLPGTYDVQATLRGTSTYPGSSATLTYEVTKAPTTLTLTPSTAAAAPTGATPLVASLRSDGAGLGGKPIVFRITSTVDSSVVERVVIADAWGDATLSNVGLPLGTYQVQASFGTGVTVSVSDANYGSSTSGTSTLTLQNQTPPVITAAATVAGGQPYTAGAWTNSNVTVTFTCTASPLTTISSCTPPQTVTTPGTTTSVTGTAVDASGLSASTSFGPIRIDQSGPTITITTPAASASYQLGAAVTPAFTCVDALSGTATCTSTPIDTATAGAKTFTVTATDLAGNTSTASVNYTVVSGNQAPTVVADMGVPGLQEIGFRGNAAVIAGTFTDPDGRAPYRAYARWTATGAFTPFAIAANGAFVAAYVYPNAGVRTVTIRVCDAQGACGTDDITVRVGISQRVVPVLQCVTDRRPASPRYRAVFGYNNPAPFPVAAITVPFVENWFNPLPALRGQPQVFLPGNQRNVFTADFNSGTLSWTLQGTTVQARSNTTRC
jgi:hypothetical protein